MRNGIREFIKNVISEDVKKSDTLTGKWLEANDVDYDGDKKNDPYFVYFDEKGREVKGDIKRRGDPYTYKDLGDGTVLVTSGPNRASVGSIIQKSDLSQTSGGGSASGDADAQTDQFRAFMGHIRLAIGHALRATLNQEAFRNSLSGKVLSPSDFFHINLDGVGNNFHAISNIGNLENLKTFSDRKAKDVIYGYLSTPYMEFDPITRSLDMRLTGGLLSSDIDIARAHLAAARKIFQSIRNTTPTQEQQENLTTLAKFAFYASSVMGSPESVIYVSSDLGQTEAGSITVFPVLFILGGKEREEIKKVVDSLLNV